MMFADQALARRLEWTDALAGVEYARAWAKVHSHEGRFSLEVAGGRAGFSGADSPVTQAFGLGLNGPVAEEDFDSLEEFYRTQGAAVNIETCPLADGSLLALLNARGYRPIEYSNVLAKRLGTADVQESHESGSKISIRRSGPEDDGRVVQVLLGSFFEGAEITPKMLDIFSGMFEAACATFFIAELSGKSAGAAMVAIVNGVASLGGAGTLPEFRNRGVQSALIESRVNLAAESGCDLAMVATSPGSGSQRNAERHGFRVMYTRTKFLREWK